MKLCVCEVKLETLNKGDSKAPFSIATTPRCSSEGTTPFSGLLQFTLDLHLYSAKQGGIKYLFFFFFFFFLNSLWYDSTWDWTLVSWIIDEHSTHY